jgi:hypothetical protein
VEQKVWDAMRRTALGLLATMTKRAMGLGTAETLEELRTHVRRADTALADFETLATPR